MSDQEKVLVPALIGLEVGDAHELAFAARVVAVAADPATPLPTAGVVTAQDPSAGTRVDPAATVAIAVDAGPADGGGDGGGGGGGRPLPTPPPGPRDPAGTKPVG
ncbi:PASTA domain-containing protein [Pseudonocardia kunmingensis]|uniref:PASTA domain-containing protein n=1 Tax=Pseudonocardia kunmingensis TaxID=630975 RepID=UPI0014795B58|nr:PASTA domain-containing protein [Pseudonocardia kunmingensis]